MSHSRVGGSPPILFDRDEMIFSSRSDISSGKIYRAGRPFGVPEGMVEVIDTKTGSSEFVPADATGTRPRNMPK